MTDTPAKALLQDRPGDALYAALPGLTLKEVLGGPWDDEALWGALNRVEQDEEIPTSASGGDGLEEALREVLRHVPSITATRAFRLVAFSWYATDAGMEL